MRLSALLDCHSYFSFGLGASSPTRLVERAAELGYTALALTDVNGVYGAVEAQKVGKMFGVKVLVGATVTLEVGGEGYPLVLIAQDRRGYTVRCCAICSPRSTRPRTRPSRCPCCWRTPRGSSA